MSLGDRIKAMRNRKGLTQSELAKRVNVSAQVISNWEREYTTPTSSDIARLAEVLDTSADYLLGRTDNPDPETSELEIDPELKELWEQIKQKGLEIEAKGFLQRAVSPHITKEQLRDILKVFEHIAQSRE